MTGQRRKSRDTANIRDVAQLAGVSAATVSHVLNGTRFVSEQTQDKVFAAIRELNYSPNIMARKFKTGLNDTVGFIVPDIANGYFATLIQEVEEVLSANGFRLIVSNTREDPQRELDSIRTLSSGVVDGFVVASSVRDSGQFSGVLPEGFPVVFVDRLVQGAPGDFVITENATAIRQGVTDLVEAGFERIGVIASSRYLSTTVERVEAYRAALQSCGIDSDPRLVAYLTSISDPIEPALQSLIDLGCTAILASNNVVTNRLLRIVSSARWRERNLRVLGYRDPVYEIGKTRRISFIEEPVVDMGRIAGEAIVHRIAEPQTSARHVTLHAVVDRS